MVVMSLYSVNELSYKHAWTLIVKVWYGHWLFSIVEKKIILFKISESFKILILFLEKIAINRFG